MSREYIQRHQRERLIRGMVEAVEARGYSATSVADVAAIAAGLADRFLRAIP